MVQPPTKTWPSPHQGNDLAMGTPCRQQGPFVQARSATGIASAGNRARVTSMATMYSATRPLMQLTNVAPGHLKLQKLTVHVLPRVASWALTIQAQVACRASWLRY